MIKKILLSLFLIVSINGFPNNPKTYVCLKSNSIIKIDGKIKNAEWGQISWTDDFVDIEGVVKLIPEFRTRVKMQWDENYFYIAVELEEPHICATLTKNESVIFHDNDFEVFIDPDGDALNYAEFEINAFATYWDLLMDKPYSKKGNANTEWNFNGIKKAVFIDGTINNPSDTDKKWTIEIAIPWSCFCDDPINVKKPKSGENWRMNFSRVQWEYFIADEKYIKRINQKTGKACAEKNYVWSPQGSINMHIPEKWGYVRFSDKHPVKSKNWIWMNFDKKKSLKQWDSTFCFLQNHSIRGILIQAGVEQLKEIIPIAKNYNIEVHVWKWILNCNDKDIIKNHPDWYVINRNGVSCLEKPPYVGYYRWLCPSNPEVLEYLKVQLKDYCKIDGLKGIHFDYIRFPDVILPEAIQPNYGLKQDKEFPEYDFCYCDKCISSFKQKHGYDPSKSEDPSQDSLWLKYRYNSISKIVNELADYIHSFNKEVSAAVFPTPEIARTLVRQDWNNWKLNAFFPMIYHNFYYKNIDWITSATNQGVINLPDSVSLFSGVYIPVISADEINSVINAAKKGGAEGISIFDINAMTPEHWEKLQK